jgi:hypothetical protein
MSDAASSPGRKTQRLSSAAARRLEWSIIALGIVALALIFQPFSLTMFGIGCGLVVFAGLANNLLPLCQPGTTVRSIVVATVIVAFAFIVVMLVSIAAAFLYGIFFVKALAPDTNDPFYLQPFVWGVAAIAVALAALLGALLKSKAVVDPAPQSSQGPPAKGGGFG